ncbi:hypothetical protein [Inquilinus sp. CAU 1745]|uniref:hypothetical protein n=1 Tax=Inquilinus sp. CAU 1745 TaxID=3140369 RepID=UPI00325A81DB
MNVREQAAYDAITQSTIGVDIVGASESNLKKLRAMNLTEDEKNFVNKFEALPLMLEHRSSDAENSGWHAIKGKTKTHGGVKNGDAAMLSLFELAKLIASRSGKTEIAKLPLDSVRLQDVKFKDILDALGGIKINTSERDFTNFGNIDFVFYKLNVKGKPVVSANSGGVASGKPKYFGDSKLLEVGWISFDDWVSYSANQTFSNSLNTAWYGFPSNSLKVKYQSDGWSKTYTYTAYKEIGKSYTQHSIDKMPPAELRKTASEEVFWGPHIKPGIALTLVEHLRLADPSGTWIKGSTGGGDLSGRVAKLMAGIWKLIEAKIPGNMPYYQFRISKSQATPPDKTLGFS